MPNGQVPFAIPMLGKTYLLNGSGQGTSVELDGGYVVKAIRMYDRATN